MQTIPVITVDGPSGSGKGTLSRLLAVRFHWHLLDSGALYRVLAVAAQKHGLSWEDYEGLTALAKALDVDFKQKNGQVRIVLEQEDVTDKVRTETCGQNASIVAVIPSVREALLARQRAFKRPPGLIADGRDMGTVVFPDAPFKVFLEASSEERAKRRYAELQERGLDVSLDNLLSEIQARDIRDKERKASPLLPADDAFILETTSLGISGVYDAVMAKIAERGFEWYKV